MFTSLRSRLWLSYALVITLSLTIVSAVLLIFLIRNPFQSRQIQQEIRSVLSEITANPKKLTKTPQSLMDLANTSGVRILIFDSARRLLVDTNPNEAALPFPRLNLLNRVSQTAVDGNGKIWLYTSKRLADRRMLMVAALRPPRVPVLNVFADAFLLPVVQGGLIALLFSLVLAFVLSRWVADPLQEIVTVAQSYPADAAKPVMPRGPREVKTLARVFNSMLERVQASHQSQRDFVANVSHELKTPLTSIQGFAQAILDNTVDTPEARQRAAQVIYDESTRMHRMALDLMDLARLEAGIADLNMSAVDVGALLRGVSEKFSLQASKAGVKLQITLTDNLPPLIADGDRLAQVLSNLVDNALRFTPLDGQVTLSAKKTEAETELSVADTGSGVAPEALPRLFDRFYQVDPARAGGEQHGAGLGLAIVKEIVEAHGGKIGVRSQVGSGTIFTIHLPLAST